MQLGAAFSSVGRGIPSTEALGLSPNMGPYNCEAEEDSRQYTLSFSCSRFAQKSWLSACSEVSILFCFPGPLFQTAGTEPAWIKAY